VGGGRGQIGVFGGGRALFVLPEGQRALGGALDRVAAQHGQARRRRAARALRHGGIADYQLDFAGGQVQRFGGDLHHDGVVALPHVGAGDGQRGLLNLDVAFQVTLAQLFSW